MLSPRDGSRSGPGAEGEELVQGGSVWGARQLAVWMREEGVLLVQHTTSRPVS